MSNLIRVDDHKIRKTAFSRVDRLLKKLLRMEANLESFYERDQRLFNEWHDLTFRDRRQQMDQLRGEYRDLAQFHNWMHALSEMEGLSLPQAAFQLREEERLHREGSVEERARIDELRRLREAFIDTQAEREQQRSERRRRSREEEDVQRTRPISPDPSDIEELELLAEMEDSDIEEWCADPDVAFLLLGKALRVATFTKDYQLFFRLWDLIHPKIQGQFAKQFQKSTGVSLYEAIERMRRKVDPESAISEKGPLPVEPPPDAGESIKLLYRQLARKLHPDMHATRESDSASDWRKKMWLRVQAAYKEEDAQLLGKLFHLVLLRGRELNDLRLSDLHLSHQWLADEIGQTEQDIRNLRRLPAWGFSRRKDYSAITRRLERQMVKDHRRLEEQVVDLRIHHAFLERMGREENLARRERRQRKAVRQRP